MKKTPKIRRVTLNNIQSTESVLLGVVAAEPDYKLSLALNKKLGISLKNSDPVIIPDENNNEQIFSRFSYTSNVTGIIYDLISNRSGKQFLIRKMKNIDYFFLIHDIDNETSSAQILSLVRESDYVTAAFKIETNIIKDKNIKYLIP